MALTQTACSSFKQELLEAIHDFTTDTFKIALYLNTADLGTATTAYSATGEASGGSYVAGGAVLTGVTVGLDGTTAYVDFGDVSWSGAITARGALIYNASKASRAVAVLNFGADKTSAVSFDVQMPAPGADTALIRVA